MRPAVLPVLVFALVTGACAHSTPALGAGRSADAPRCRATVDTSGRRVDAPVRWYDGEADGSAREAIATACRTIGPGVFQGPAAVPSSFGARPVDRLAVVSWNVHVGGGDVGALVRALRAGELTGGEPVADFVLILHEAFRGGGQVPAAVPPRVSVPRRIAPRTPTGRRIDVVETGRALGLGVFYLPSMRNGREEGERAEDRGNAILSTLPLGELTAIELPYARQRRVAITAAVEGADSRMRPWRLRVVAAHLNATAGADRLWVFASGLRERQARSLVSALGEDATPTVIGSDLNTWAGGAREPAFVELSRRFPGTDPASGGAMFRGGPRLDFVFFRLPSSWLGRSRPVLDRFGSDHHPIVGWVSVNATD